MLDGDHWVINGQKMFTSGAHLAQYVFLLTRTDTTVAKHKGLTMFLVPLDTPGIEIQPIHTISDERTNATFYADVHLPDRYRVGPVNGGWAVIRMALDLEHGGGTSAAGGPHRELVEAAAAWARANGRWDDPRVRERLGFVATRAEIARLLGWDSSWRAIEGLPSQGEGAMRKLFIAEAWIEDAADMMDLCAPDSILSKGVDGAVGRRRGRALVPALDGVLDLRRVERDHAQHRRPGGAGHAAQPELRSGVDLGGIP